MPYTLLKVPGGYFVINIITGKTYSKMPLTRRNANRQLHALRQAHAPERRLDDDEDIEGAGLFDFLKNTFQKTKNIASNIASNVSGRIVGTITGRDDYPPAERAIIEKYRDKVITGICIYRHKLDKGVNMLVNTISLGQFNRIKNKYGYDDLYHLMMVVSLEGDIPILIEKNEVINIHEYPNNIKPDWQKYPLSVPTNWETFGVFLDNTRQFMGGDYFTYDALNNNCQRFIKSFIIANPPLQQENPQALQFIEQDTSGLQRDFHPMAKTLFRGITDLASRLNVLAKGRGFDPSNPNHVYNENL